MKKTFYRAAAAFCLLGAASQSQAACIDVYGGAGIGVLEGNTVCFVYDIGSVDSLYGTLSVSGDSIFSTPTDFIASSQDGASVETQGVGTVRVVAKDGFELTTINVGERGNYLMTAGDTSVSINSTLDIFDWGSPISGSYDSSLLTVSGDMTLQDGIQHNWSAFASFDLTDPLWDDINDIGMTLTNTLNAYTLNLGESASITKTLAGTELISIETTIIPVPAAVWLFGSGLIGLATIARRRKQ